MLTALEIFFNDVKACYSNKMRRKLNRILAFLCHYIRTKKKKKKIQQPTVEENFHLCLCLFVSLGVETIMTLPLLSFPSVSWGP